ncbi:hypothetical protein B0A48_15831 [Cryoendolithus antarcticus]|uniref:Uncharacterized protein n=1 Tax=Cryoendolithus antarcticus TaxID=1507870 RepID=A0A1V8SHK8_9PEZI|nr:hypothetical protein B0A48_15831 [Cryoendolithus antarcticus]
MGIPMWMDPDEVIPASSSSSSNRIPGALGRYSDADLRALRDSMEIERTARRNAATDAIHLLLRADDSVIPSVPAATATTAANLPRLRASAAPATSAAPPYYSRNVEQASGNAAINISTATVNAAAVDLLRLANARASVTITAPPVNPPTTEQASSNTTVDTPLPSLTRATAPLATPRTSTSATANIQTILTVVNSGPGSFIRGLPFTPSHLAQEMIFHILTEVENVSPEGARLRRAIMMGHWSRGEGMKWAMVEVRAASWWARWEKHIFLNGGNVDRFDPEGQRRRAGG